MQTLVSDFKTCCLNKLLAQILLGTMKEQIRKGFLLTLGLLILICTSMCSGQGPNMQGCFVDEANDPTFVSSPGRYDPAVMNPSACSDACEKNDFRYGGIQDGKYCFCSDTLPATQASSPTDCSSPCSDNSTSSCGGPNGLTSVYDAETGVDITGLKLTANRYQIEAQEIVQFTMSIEEGVDVNYKIDYGDGEQLLSVKNASGMASHRYPIPGQYYVTVYASDNYKPQDPLAASVTITVTQTVGNILIDCPSIKSPSETFLCNISMLRGPAVSMTVDKGDSSNRETYPVSASTYGSMGHSVPQVEVTDIQDVSVDTTILMSGSIMDTEGYVVAIEAYVTKPGDVDFLILSPSCTSGQASCTAPPAAADEVYCSDVYYPVSESCDSTLSAPVWSPASTYGQRAVHTATATAAGYVYVDLTATNEVIKVFPGDALALQAAAGMAVAYRNATAEEVAAGKADKHSSSLTGPWADTTYAHYARAIVSRPASVSIQHAYDLVGNYTFAATCTDNQGNSTSNSTVIAIVAGIDAVSISVEKLFWAVGSPVNITATVYNGSGFDVTWDFGDETQIETTHESGSVTESSYWKEHTYSVDGTVLMTVTASNVIDNRTDTKMIFIQYVVPQSITLASNSPQSSPPGTVNFTLGFSSSDPLPTNATAVVSWGDASTSTVVIANDTTTSVPMSHDYASGGEFNVSCVLSNEVSNRTVTTQVVMYERIEGLGATLMYWNGNAGTSSRPAVGVEKNTVAFNSNVSIEVTKVRGTIMGYSFYKEDGTWIQNTTNNVLYYPVADKGNYNVTVYAWNPAQGESDPLTICIVAADISSALEINDFFETTDKNETKTFEIVISSLTNDMCMVVYYGDELATKSLPEVYGDLNTCHRDYTDNEITFVSSELQSPKNVTHLYNDRGQFTINVTTFNAATTSQSSLVFSVTYFPCEKPVLKIKDERQSVSDAIEKLKSEGFPISTVSTINCTDDVTTTKEWRIYKVDEKFGLEEKPVDISTVSSKNKSILYVPPRFLPYGSYKLVYILSITTNGMDPKFPWIRSIYTFVKIIPSPLIAIIIDGSMSEVLRGVGQRVMLKPADLSSDPDFPDDHNFNITWLCRRVLPSAENYTMNGDKYDRTDTIPVPNVNDTKPSTDNGGCFGTGPGVLQMTNANEWTIDTSIFYAKQISYEIMVLISKDSRETGVAVIVKLVDGMPPNIEIRCQNTEICFPTGDGLLINPTSRLGVTGNCFESCDEPLEYQWTMYNADTNAVIDTAADYMCGANEEEMAISRRYFGNNTGIRAFHLQLTARGPHDTGDSRLFMKVNRPPEQGSCEIMPSNGRALLDTFIIRCTGWIDPDNHQITAYTFYIVMESAQGKTVISSGYNASTDVILPYGTISIKVDISDQYDAVTIVDVATLSPTLPSKQEYEDFLQSSFVSNLIGGGDQEKICQVVLAIASIESSGVYKVSPPVNGTDEEYDNYRIQASQRITELLDGVQTLTTATLTDLEMVSSTISAVIGTGLDVDARGKKTATEILETLGNVLAADITPKSPQELQPFAESAVSIIGGIVESIANTLVDGNILPSDLKFVDETVYDTDIGEDSDYFEMPRTIGEMHRKAIIGDTAYNGNEQVQKMETVFDKVGLEILTLLVPDEEPIKVTTNNGVSAIFGKYRASNISRNGFELEDASFVLPSICALLHQTTDHCTNDESIGIQSIELPAILQSFGKRIDLLSKNTKTIKLQLFDHDNKEMSVKNISEPVDLFIPRMNVNGTVDMPPAVNVTPRMKWFEQMVYHQFNVTKIASSVNIELTPDDDSIPMLIFVRFGKKPTISDYDHLKRLIDIPKKNDTYDLFFSSLNIGNKTGPFYLGIAELNTSHPDANYDVLGNYTANMMLSNMTTTYTIRIYTSGCYYYDERRNAWRGDGCWVHNANYTMTHCKCNHLTTFGSGFFVSPNTVNFDYVFAHASFNDNLTIYLTLIITFSVFIIMLVWARWKDRKDVEKLGATPLPDNLPEDKYLYEILVFTGNKRSAATDSQVYFILSGEEDETEVRHFADDKRKIFRKGEIDVFVMATARPLGVLNYMRIWHDNSGRGKYGSWHLNYIAVRDVQTGDKFQFVGNCWFAIEEGDGSIDRLLPVAGYEQLTEFGHLFTNTSQRGITDNHLWFSVFLRPPRSRFTRAQRVGCCVAFLYLSMLVNAMWYGTVSNTPQGSAFQFGPFSISTQQIGVGLISNLIVFPPNFIIVYFFRKARPRKLRPSRIEEALKKQNEKDKNEEMEDDRRKKVEDCGSQAELTKHEVENENVKCDKALRGYKPKKKFTLPWIFQIVAWLLVVACIGASIFFLWSYGISFGNEKTKQWITSLVISFFSSVLITEPLKLFLMAMLFSAICKTADDDQDDADEDEEDPLLLADEEYLHGLSTKRKRTKYRAPDPDVLNKAREVRLKEIKMWGILREILGYLLFLWILVVVSYGNRDPNSYYMKQTLAKAFIQQGKDFDFSDMRNTTEFWNWSRAILIPKLRAKNLYNNKPPFGYKGFLQDQVNRLMGHAIMRQIRIDKNECHPPDIMKNVSYPCSGTFANLVDEDNLSYDIGWKNTIIEDSEPVDKITQAFRYRTAESLNGIPFVGDLDVYSGGGYVIELTGRTADLQKQFQTLQANNWIDRFTRAVLVEFSVYNTQVNLFGVCVIQLEFVPGGGFFQDYRFDGIRLLQYHDGFGLVVLICEIGFVLFTLYFAVHEIIEMCKEKTRYCSSYWNLAEICMVLLSIGAIVVYVCRMVVTNSLLDDFNQTKGNKYINLQYVYMLDQTFGYFISFVVFLATIKFIKLLRFNKRIGILSSTLAHAWAELGVFGLCFLIVFMAFVQLFYLIMSATSVDFAGFLRTIEYTFSMMLNKFNFNEINRGCPILGPLAFFVFSLMTSIVLVNLLLTIIIKSFENVAHDVFKQPNDYEIVEFILNRFRGFVGFNGGRVHPMATTTIGPPPGGYVDTTEADNKVLMLPERVDILLHYINDVYFDGKIDLKDKQQVKNMFAN